MENFIDYKVLEGLKNDRMIELNRYYPSRGNVT